MADTYKVLAQSKPGAASLTDAYTVPAATEAIISSIIACNQGAATAIRISIAVAALADTPKQYIAYDLAIGANECLPIVVGATLAATDVVRVYNTLATVSFNIFGVEKA